MIEPAISKEALQRAAFKKCMSADDGGYRGTDEFGWILEDLRNARAQLARYEALEKAAAFMLEQYEQSETHFATKVINLGASTYALREALEAVKK
jgi:hypothetical protein